MVWLFETEELAKSWKEIKNPQHIRNREGIFLHKFLQLQTEDDGLA